MASMASTDAPLITYIASYKTSRKNNKNVHQCSADLFLRRLTEGHKFAFSKADNEVYGLSPAALTALRSPHLCEILLKNPFVKVYYDWDCNVHSESDIAERKESEIDALEGALEVLHPDAEIYLADRSGWNAEKRIWKISLRAFIQGAQMRVGDIALHIKSKFPGDTKPAQLDTAVYKTSEQLMGCIGCTKTPEDSRVLRVLDEAPDAGYVIQDTRGCTVLEVDGGPMIVAPHLPLATPMEIDGSGEEDLLAWLSKQFNIEEHLIRINDSMMPNVNTLIIPTRSRACPFGRPHKSNHIMIQAVVHKSISVRCHDPICKDPELLYRWRKIPSRSQNILLEMTKPRSKGNPGETTTQMIVSETTSTIDPMTMAAQIALSAGINKALKTGTSWTWENDGKKKIPKGIRTIYSRVIPSALNPKEPVCIDCLRDPTHKHHLSSACTLSFGEVQSRKGQTEKSIHIECINDPSNNPPNLLQIHPGLYELHHTYDAHLHLSGSVDVKVTKAKDQEFEKCWSTLVSKAISEELLRGESQIYLPLAGKPCCYVPGRTFLKFVQSSLDELPEYVNSARAHKDLMQKIKDAGDKRFPFREDRLNLSWIGCSNGLFYLGEPMRGKRQRPKFIPFDEVPDEIRDSVVVRHYIDQTFDPEMGSPAFDTMISHQLQDPEIVQYFKAFIGRLLFPVRSDGHQVALMILGVARTGKSTVIEAVKNMVGLADIASFSGEGEKVFGIGGGKLDKSLIIIDDLPSDTKKMLTGTEFQAMVTGGIVDAKSKNKDARTVDWKIPFCIATNVWPNWPDNDGSLVRRIVTFFLETPLDSADTQIAEAIIGHELPNILWSCVNAYFDLLLDNPLFAHKQFYDACPEYFQIGRTRHINSLDKVNGFFHAAPEDLRLVVQRDVNGDPLEWWQYEVEIRHNEHQARRKYGSLWGQVQDAFQVYKDNMRLRETLSPTNECWKRNRLHCGEDNFYDFRDSTRKRARHVLGLYVNRHLVQK